MATFPSGSDPAKAASRDRKQSSRRFAGNRGLRCHELSVVFDSGRRAVASRTAVDNVCFTVDQPSIVALVGPSGCGKTTLIRTLAGLQSPTSGSVAHFTDPSAPAAEEPRNETEGTRDDATEQRRLDDGEIGFVFQQPSLLPWLSAGENVALPLKIIHDSADRDRRVHDLLKEVQLPDAADLLPRQMSGGMQMRVALARALVTEPTFLLLDEPFAALDQWLRDRMGQLLIDLWRRHRFIAVLVTHNISEAIDLAHRILVMDRGRIVLDRTNEFSLSSNEENSPTQSSRDAATNAWADDEFEIKRRLLWRQIASAIAGDESVADEAEMKSESKIAKHP